MMTFLRRLPQPMAFTLALSACSSGPGGQGDLAGPALSGSLSLNFRDDQGAATTVGIDISQLSVAALVADGHGGFNTYSGQGQSNGSFSVPGVPPGVTYYLALGTAGSEPPPTYVVSTQRTLDLSYDVLGRQNTAQVSQSTPITWNVTGLSPWQSGDSLELFSSGADVYVPDITGGAGLAKGVTSSAGLMVDYLNLGGDFPLDLIDGSQGDVAYLTQLPLATSDKGVSYQGLTQALRLPAFTITDGAALTLSGALQPAMPLETVSVTWNTAAFEALQTALHPAATVGGHVLTMEVQPGGLAYGVADSAADLLYASANAKAGDIPTGTLSYGNPYPTTWGEFGFVRCGFTLSYLLPGTTTPATVAMTVDYSDARASFLAAPLSPQLGPVQQPQLNGQSALSTLSDVGTTPTLTFAAPALGTATAYDVTVYQLGTTSASSTQTAMAMIATLYTTQTTLQIPVGLLQSGGTYALAIRARQEPNTQSPDVNPFHSTLPSATATSYTAMFTP